ncbi:hypothetical protein GGS20DRAFT_585920 [Poronia punctata]|nr:hypothetical protein GGS20DRAFT_585920 [Poronia punctata]
MRPSCGRLSSLAIVLLLSGFPGIRIQRCVAQEETTTTTTTTPPPNPWPTDTTYTIPPESILTTIGTPNHCLLSYSAHRGDPGFRDLNCFNKVWTTTERRSLTFDCRGCDEIRVTVQHPGCPMGGHGHPPVTQATPSYKYVLGCAPSTAVAVAVAVAVTTS